MAPVKLCSAHVYNSIQQPSSSVLAIKSISDDMAFICECVGFQLLDIRIGQTCSNHAEERGRGLADTLLLQLLLHRMSLHLDINSRARETADRVNHGDQPKDVQGIRSIGGSSNSASSLPSQRASGQTELYCREDQRYLQFTFNHMLSGKYSISSACIRHHRNVRVMGFKQPTLIQCCFQMEDKHSHTGKHLHNQAQCSEPGAQRELMGFDWGAWPEL